MAENPSIAPYMEQQIRERAYEIYQARECQNGDEVSDWVAAERELKESNQPQGTKKRAAVASVWRF
jgi:hypothetical protein